MTGLDPKTDIILSISCIITTHDLTPLSAAYNATILTSPTILSTMSPWCISTHTRTGLVAACTSSAAIPASLAATQLLAHIQAAVPTPRRALLAGNSVHVDKLFLMCEPWSAVVEYLHYRILDVSAIKEACRRWCAEEVLSRAPVKTLGHVAEDDVNESLEEARFYMGLLGGVR